MKKIYFLVTSLLLLTGFVAKSQCTNGSPWGTVIAPTINTTPTTITPTCAFAGEYSTITGAVAGATYQFNVTGGTSNFLTVHQGTPGGLVLGFGPPPLSVTCTVSGNLYLHYNTNASCGTESQCRTATIQCTSCPPPVSPPNELCTGALPIACGQTITGTTVGAASDPVGTCVTTLNTAPGIWYTFVGDGLITTLSMCGSGYDTKIGVFSGSCAALTCVTGNDDFCGLSSQVTFPTVIGTNYYILVTGFGTATGSFTLTRTCFAPPPNDLCSGAITINCGQTITGTTVGATTDAVPTCVTTLNTAPGVWYTFVGNGQINILSLCGSSYDTKIGVFSGACTGVCVTGNDDFCGLGSQVQFFAASGVQYNILVTGFSTATGAFTLVRTCLPPPPNDLCTGAITINCAQTITGTTSNGATPDLTAPTCTTPLNTAPGMWYTFVGNGTPNILSLCGSSFDTKIGVYSGSCAGLVCVLGNDNFCGTQSQVTVNTTAGTNYYILVTGNGTAQGNFTLTRTCACTGVPSPGSITGPAATQCRNASVTLNLTGFPTGVAGISYQWNSAPAAAGPYTPITGATGTSYTFLATTTTYYTVTVSCSFSGGSATTAPFLLNVDPLAHINVSATPSTICAGGSTAITATAVNGITATGIGVIGTSGTINLPISDPPGPPTTHTIAIPAVNIPNAASLRVRVNMNHTWVGDIAVQLTSPCGTTFLFDRPGTTGVGFGNADDLNGVYTFDVAAATIIPEVGVGGTIAPGSYIPSTAAGAANPTWAPLTFPCAGGGNWTITITDFVGGDVGTLIDWQIIGPLSGNYTHTLTGGPGTITQNPSTGPLNATGNFTVTNVPAGNHTYVITSTDPFGCSVSSNVPVTVNPLPTIVFSPTSATICNGQIQQVNVYATPGGPQTLNSGCAITIPGTGTVGNGSPYPCVLSVSGLPTAGVTVRSVTISNYDHTFPDDVDLVLVSPTGVPVILMSDAGGSALATGQILTFQDGAPALADNAFNNTGTYRPTNYLTPDNFPAPGPGSLTQALPTLASFTGDVNGSWRLYAVDDLSGNTGVIGNWSITFNVPAPVVLTQSPAAPNSIFTNAAATIPYVAGTPVYTVWVAPTVTTTYTGNATVAGCAGPPVTMTVTVNQPPVITTHPLPATQTVCPGFTVSYTVVATGTGLTYQWRRNGVNLVNGGFISGVNTPTLTIANVQAANAGTYDVVVSGTCPPAVTSNPAVLNVGSAPTITTQPANATVCEGSNATFSVVAAGTPTPTIYQWQSSPDGVTWTNLTTGGAFGPTLTVSNVTLAMNGLRYRVIITNSCGMTITSSVATLTVNPRPVVTATPLPSRICLSDTLVPLVGSPTGGSWSGVGVSGFNFVPMATAVGTYTLTYSFTSAAGCTNTTTLVAKVEDCPERIRLLSNDGVIVYPNPNNGQFNIRVNSTLYNYLGMKVYDMTGRLVNGKVVKNGTDQALVSPVFTGLVYGRVIPVDLRYLPAGMYLVKIYYDDGIRSSEKGFLISIME